MDPLSDVMALLKPRSYLTAGLDLGGPWAIRFTNNVGTIKCYALARGACWLAMDGLGDPTRLMTGDCIVVPNGRSFTLAADLNVAPTSAGSLLASAQHGATVTQGGGGDTLLLGNRFEVDSRKAAALLGALPPVVHLAAEEEQSTLRWSIERMMGEMREERPGLSVAAHHLAQLMLLQALRAHLAQQAKGKVGWFYALADPQIGKAMSAMHAAPARRWTLSTLAGCAGLSRAVFAQRFRDRVGDTPIAYLTRWRMLLAAERLTSEGATLAQAAEFAGYGSENAFNTAFRRVMGSSPRHYARHHASDYLRLKTSDFSGSDLTSM